MIQRPPCGGEPYSKHWISPLRLLGGATGAALREEAAAVENKNVRAIFNVRNFGQFNSPYYGMINTSGDCTITICADFQDPVEMIPKFVAEWEKGYKIVIGKKTCNRVDKHACALLKLLFLKEECGACIHKNLCVLILMVFGYVG